MEHSFDIEFAQKYGVNAAIVYRNFQYWIAKNKANKKNLIDGRNWTYNSRRGLTDLFPYMTDWDIRQALKKLTDEKILITGTYNKKGYDRTTWYAFKDEKTALKGYPSHLWNSPIGETDEKTGGESHRPIGESHRPIGESHRPIGESHQPIGESHQSIGEFHQPIPNPKPNSKPDNKPNTKAIGISSDEILRLDLEIAEQRNLFLGQITEIFRPHGKEITTFTRIAKYLTDLIQQNPKRIGVFKDATEWAMQAKASTASNKKGLFVAKVKQETGFKGQANILSRAGPEGNQSFEQNQQKNLKALRAVRS